MDSAQIRDRLLAEILDGGPEAQHVFDEYSTVRRLGVARATLREALSSLTEAGLLTRSPRLGTSLATDLHYWTVERSATDSATQSVRYETVGIERVVPYEALSIELTGTPDATVTRVERVNVVDGRAAEYWTIWTVLDLPASVHQSGLPVEQNWYQYVGNLTGSTSLQMTRRVIHCRATQSDLSRLDVQLGDPLRFTSRLLTHPDGRVIDRAWGRTNAQVVVPSEKFTITL